MGIIAWIILGAIVGYLAKFIMPSKESSGLIITILLGIAGAFIGGFVGSLLKIGTFTGFNLWSILLAIGGACLLLFVYRLIKKS